MDCLFCNILNGSIPSYKLYEDDFCIAILDAFPDVDGHTLIIPKEHHDDFKDLNDELILHMHNIAKGLSTSLMEKLKADSITLLINYGESQKVKHFHLHLLPQFTKSVKASKTPKEMYEIITK